MSRTDSPIDDFLRYDRERERERELLPRCSMCGEPIEEETCYEINDELICEGCLEAHFKRVTSDFY
jgi:formylmethanofuran dehydrogenase subunit E